VNFFFSRQTVLPWNEGVVGIWKGKSTRLNRYVLFCGFCDYVSCRPTHMRDHVRKHTGEKPFRCQFCGRSFARKFSLKIHVCSTQRGDLWERVLLRLKFLMCVVQLFFLALA
jgi:hypothetical protein